jgi:hypothetical protein
MNSFTITWQRSIGEFPIKKLSENGFSVSFGDEQKVTIFSQKDFNSESIFWIGVSIGLQCAIPQSRYPWVMEQF